MSDLTDSVSSVLQLTDPPREFSPIDVALGDLSVLQTIGQFLFIIKRENSSVFPKRTASSSVSHSLYHFLRIFFNLFSKRNSYNRESIRNISFRSLVVVQHISSRPSKIAFREKTLLLRLSVTNVYMKGPDANGILYTTRWKEIAPPVSGAAREKPTPTTASSGGEQTERVTGDFRKQIGWDEMRGKSSFLLFIWRP